MKTKNKYFVLLSTCELIDELKEKSVDEVESEFDNDNQSLRNFHDFIDKMVQRDMAITTNNPECFPPMSEQIDYQSVLLQDAIIEIDQNKTDRHKLNKIFSQLSELHCTEWQIRLLSPFDTNYILSLLDEISKTETLYLEIHCENSYNVTDQQLRLMIEKYAFLANIYLYGCEHASKTDVCSTSISSEITCFCTIYRLNYSFQKGQCCGQICIENMDFSNIKVNHRLKKTNGCLYKKICFDVDGNIKNCPSLHETFGNIDNINIQKIIENKDFTKLWYITHNDIDACKDCEYRLNCTGCSAFVQQTGNPLSKPSKCNYDPYTCKWQ